MVGVADAGNIGPTVREASVAMSGPTGGEGEDPVIRRPLDFIVLGVGRSGTTALARALNLDPAIFCAIEYFHEMPRGDFARMRMPDAFFDEAWRATTPQNTRNSREMLRAKLAAGPVGAYGNKHPSYTLVMDAVNAAMPGLRNLCIYRGPAAIADSWERRAVNPRDAAWPSGRVGLYGVISWLLLLSRLVEARQDVRIIDYRALFFESPDYAEATYRYVTAGEPSSGVMDRFRAEMFNASPGSGGRGRSGGGRTAPAGGPHDRFLQEIGAPDLDALMTGHGFTALDPVRETLRAFVAAAFPPAARYLGDWVEANAAARQDVLDFGWKWAASTLNGWDTAESPTLAASVPLLAGFMDRLARLDPALAAQHAARVRNVAERLPAGLRAEIVALHRGMPRPASAAATAAARKPPAQVYQAGQHAMNARALSREGKAEEALAEARLAEAAAPEELRYRSLLADALLKAGETEEARQVLEAELARFPEDAVLLRLHSRLLARLGRLEEAEAAARRSLERAPADGASRRWLERVGRLQRAEERRDGAKPAAAAAGEAEA
jgi:tetratricopeptide (TPR) repeat protein